jgi:hypothetical protein
MSERTPLPTGPLPRIKLTIGQQLWETSVSVNGQLIPVTRISLVIDANDPGHSPYLTLECRLAPLETTVIEGVLQVEPSEGDA